VLVQCRLQDNAAIEALRREVSAVVHRSAGVECKVVMVPPKSLPFTSSGKLSRAGAKQKFLSGEIGELAVLGPLPGSARLEAVL
jgi:fatty-acyl-CoA synthase